MIERTERLMTKEDIQVIAQRHGDVAAEYPEVDAASRAAGGAVVGLVVGLFMWQAVGGPAEQELAWLVGWAALGAALAWYAPATTPEARRRHATESTTELYRRSDTRVVTLKASVVEAVALGVRPGWDWLVLDVEEGRLLALPTTLGEIRMGYLGFPHERFELEIAVLMRAPDRPDPSGWPCWRAPDLPDELILAAVFGCPGERVKARPLPARAEMLRYRGEGATMLPSRTLVGRQVGRISLLLARRVQTGLVFRGTLATCAADLRAARLDDGEE
ncbi:MAG: hypothetical protein HYU66_28185 [Armatimonadetes bacterium]|nr:hypothetical protein [Armatimonadota bacterium]